MEDSIDFLKKLQEDNMKLLQELLSCHTEVRRLKQENKQLREALDNCSPYTIYNDFDNDYECFFCASYDDEPHEEDCLYYMATDLHYQSTEVEE